MTLASNKTQVEIAGNQNEEATDVIRAVISAPELLTISQAAKIAGKSYTWARDHAIGGRLETRWLPESPRRLIARESLFAVLREEAAARPRRQLRRPALRLVVDNTR